MHINRFIKYYVSKIAKLFERKTIANIVTLCSEELLIGRTALITGGTSGIGYAIAISYIKAGAKVIITGRDRTKTLNCVNQLKNSYPSAKVAGIVMDISSSSSTRESFEECTKEEQTIDILVNNAGISIPAKEDIIEDEVGFDAVLNTNLKGTYMLTKLMSAYMIKHGIRGNILNIASTSCARPATNPYSISKWGIKGITLGFAKTLIKHNIVVNGIAPGPTATPMTQKGINSDLMLKGNPSTRFVLPEEIANMAVILTSEMGRMIVGDIIYIGGGAGVITVDDIKY